MAHTQSSRNDRVEQELAAIKESFPVQVRSMTKALGDIMNEMFNRLS